MAASSLLSTDEVPSREPAPAARGAGDLIIQLVRRVFREHTSGSPGEFRQQARRGA